MKSKVIDKKMISYFRNPLFLIFIINICIRLPVGGNMYGNDAFAVVWMARAIDNYWYEAWFLNPFSLIGLYPYSTYPFGFIFVLSLFFKLGLSVDLTIYIYSIFLLLLCILSCNLLSGFIFKKKQYKYWFTFFYTTNLTFLNFSYWTCSPRGPLLSLIPLILYFNLRLLKKRNLKNVILNILGLIFFASTHLGFVIYSIFILAFIFNYILEFSNYKFFNKYWRFDIVITFYIILFLLGVTIFGISGYSFINAEVENYGKILSFQAIMNLAINYSYNTGISIIIGAIGFLLILIEKKKEVPNRPRNIFLITGMFLAFFIPYFDYGILFFIPFISFFASVFIIRIQKSKFKDLITYVIVILSVIRIQIMILIILIILSLPYLIIEIFKIYHLKFKFSAFISYHKKLRKILLFLSLMSIFLIVPITTESKSTTSETRIIGEFLEKENIDDSIVLCYNFKVARKVAAYGFQPVLPNNIPPSKLYYHFLGLNKEKIISETTFDIERLFNFGSPYYHFSSFDYYQMFLPIIKINLTNPSYEEIQLLKEFHIGYVINRINESLIDNYSDLNDINPIEIRIFKTVINYGVLLFQTDNFRLFKINY